MWFVYILRCRDGSLYTGITNNLDKRLLNHKAGKGGAYTRAHIPQEILYTQQFITKSDALKREYEIKTWSRKKKIRDLRLAV